MWQYILAIILIAFTARFISAANYVRRVSGLNFLPKPKGFLEFWFKGHLNSFLKDRPFDQIRFLFIPEIMEIVGNHEMPAMFLPGPLIIKRAVLFMTDPAAVRECFSSQHMKELHKGPEYDVAKLLLGNGILASNEEEWRRQRRICDLGFANSIIKSSVEKSGEIVNIAVEKMIKTKNSDGKIIINADVEVALMAADILGLVVFGYNFNAVSAAQLSEAPIYAAFKIVLRYFADRLSKPALLPNSEFKKNLNMITSLVDKLIAAEHNKESKEGTLLSHLVNGDYKGQKLTEAEVKYNAMTFLFAGQDTTVNALSWALYYLAVHPEVQVKAREEVDRVLGKDRSKPVTHEMVKVELPYINYIMKEVLRVKPSAAFTKQTMTDITLPGSDDKSYFVPQGVILHFNPMFIQMNKKYWGEDAAEFKPDRWAKLSEDTDLSMIYFPFSQGHRSCIGANFAKAEVLTVIAKMVQSFEIKLTPETAKTPPRTGMDMTLFAETFTLELLER